MRDAGMWIIVVLVALGAVWAVMNPTSNDAPRPAPEFSLENLDGERVALSSFGGRVVVLDFWATWCKPCIKAFPGLHDLVGQYASSDVALLVVSLDRIEERARDYLAGNGFPTDNVLWSSMEESRAVKAQYGVIGIPHTFVIDREGIIRFSGHPSKLSNEDIDPWL